jgi:hypothetical protein
MSAKKKKNQENAYLEVIAKGPVTKHIKVGVMVGILSDIVEIVMLAT